MATRAAQKRRTAPSKARRATRGKSSGNVRREVREPEAGRPIMPALYGMDRAKTGTMKWAAVCRQLEQSRNYWICTTRADGRPHAMPVWGFWFDDAVVFGTGRETLKARNMARSPHVVVHLESGDDAVILECVVGELDLSEPNVRKRLDGVSRKKYRMPLYVTPESVIYQAHPKVVLAWREKDFPKSATRWVLR